MPRALLCITLLLGLLPAAASAAEDDTALVTYRTLAPETALEVAQAALAACRDKGYQVTVAVVDRSGILQALVRDRYAGPHSPETARRKAWTAVSFRTDTTELVGATAIDSPQSGVRFVDDAMMVGGGVMIEAAGSLVGAVGVSGAPSGNEDDTCARAGVEAVRLELAF